MRHGGRRPCRIFLRYTAPGDEPARVRDRASISHPFAKTKIAKEPAPSGVEGMGHPACGSVCAPFFKSPDHRIARSPDSSGAPSRVVGDRKDGQSLGHPRKRV
jgi:hypothetical protein